jgi:hypothetical protein
VNLYPVLRSFLRGARFKKSALLFSRIFNLVKYTKTLSVRNQHDRYSGAFFRLKLANSHTRADSACPLASSWCAARAQSRSEKRLARRAKNSRFNARLIPPGVLRHHHRRCAIGTAHFQIRERLRIASAASLLTVFNFVAIMRQSAANGKQNTAVRRIASAFARAHRADRGGANTWVTM